MGFLKKHYEKLILAVSLLIFIIALIYLIVVFSQPMKITDKDLKLKNNKPDYVSVFDEKGEEIAKDGKKKYEFFSTLKKEDRWQKSQNRGKDIPVSTDFMTPFKAARCFHCKQIIPLIYFDKEQDCILCHKSLHKIVVVKTKDVDHDQMSDDWERKYDLQPMNPSDKMLDKDEDGFPNYVEFVAKTEPNNALSHPSLAQRLYLTSFKRTKVPIIMKSVMKNGSENKEDWLVQLRLKIKGKWRSKFHKLNDEIKIGTNMYKITNIEYKMKDIYNPKLKQPVPTNISEIVIEKIDSNKKSPITVKIGKSVYENRVKIVLQDEAADKRIITFVGSEFTIGNETLGTESFTVKSIDLKKNTVLIEADDDKKTQYEIGKESILDGVISDLEGNEEDAQVEDPRKIKTKNDN